MFQHEHELPIQTIDTQKNTIISLAVDFFLLDFVNQGPYLEDHPS